MGAAKARERVGGLDYVGPRVEGQSAGPAPAVCMTTATSKHRGGHGGTWASPFFFAGKAHGLA